MPLCRPYPRVVTAAAPLPLPRVEDFLVCCGCSARRHGRRVALQDAAGGVKGEARPAICQMRQPSHATTAPRRATTGGSGH